MNYNLLTHGNSITRIDVSFGKIRTLPILPLCLEVLVADNNFRLERLPPLPCMLRVLSICMTGITEVVGLPETLEELYVSENPGIHLGASLPGSLSSLVANSCELETLPLLPSTLRTLSVDGNYLQELPELPVSLHVLIVSNNELWTLMAHGDFSDYRALSVLLVQNNRLERFPSAFPPALLEFNCAENQLTRLPTLPATVSEFVCFGNPWMYEFHHTHLSAKEYVNGINRFVRFFAAGRIRAWLGKTWFRKTVPVLAAAAEGKERGSLSNWDIASKASFSSMGSFLSVSSFEPFYAGLDFPLQPCPFFPDEEFVFV